MHVSAHLSPRVLAAVLAAAGALCAGGAAGQGAEADAEEMLDVVVPALDGAAATGQGAFLRVCAPCHGPNGGGLDLLGPPLVSDLYGPAERSDLDIVLAIQLGHAEDMWTFGPMPPAEGLAQEEVGPVVEFLRQMQLANAVE
jgi:mono/diheme cytochrome c family protein